MDILLGILLTFLVFLIVVLIHELGHFSTARWTGMKVEEFGFWIPPRLKALFTDKHGTIYSFNALPIGGFVRILWEDSHSPDKDKPGAFATKKWWQRSIVLLAGVTMNFLLAWIIFTWLFLVGTRPIAIAPGDGSPNGSFFIPSFEEARDMNFLSYSGITFSPLTGSIAYNAGIREGDLLLTLDGKELDTREEIVALIRENRPLDFFVRRWADVIPLTVTPSNGKVGMYIDYDGLVVHEDFTVQKPFFEAIGAGAKETYASSVLTLNFLGDLVQKVFSPRTPTDREEAKEMVAGPIGVGATFVNMVKASVPFSVIVLVIALLSVNLGVVNLLPFPALDGGRFVTTSVASVLSYFPRASRYFDYFERSFHAIGFVILLILMLAIAGLDISKLF